MPQVGDWRSRSAYDYIDDLTAPEVAWEFLRRNPDYRKDYLELSIAGQLDTDIGRAFAEKWGLCFRRRSGKSRSRASRRLVACGRSFRAFPRTISLRAKHRGGDHQAGHRPRRIRGRRPPHRHPG